MAQTIKGSLLCSNCGNAASEHVLDKYHYVESGLDNVYLTHLPVIKCSVCGNEDPAFPSQASLHRTIADAIANKKGPLEGKEFRFLRKQLALSARELAETFGVVPETVSRWENGAIAVSDLAERLIRSLVFIEKEGNRKRALTAFKNIELIQRPGEIDVDSETRLYAYA